jgi:hypothetical protein
VVGVPDGANAENNENTENQDPGTPEDQVNAEITREGVLSWWRGLFGMETPDAPYEAGGGGRGGQFMFASVEELDSVITRWEDERDGILDDRDKIADAYYAIKYPAADPMSRQLADSSKNSLANMWQHSNAMLDYAENYIAKLKASRNQMSTSEDGADQQFRSIRRV